MMTDPFLAQSAMDWLTSTRRELIVEGASSCRRCSRPSLQLPPDSATP